MSAKKAGKTSDGWTGGVRVRVVREGVQGRDARVDRGRREAAPRVGGGVQRAGKRGPRKGAKGDRGDAAGEEAPGVGERAERELPSRERVLPQLLRRLVDERDEEVRAAIPAEHPPVFGNGDQPVVGSDRLEVDHRDGARA